MRKNTINRSVDVRLPKSEQPLCRIIYYIVPVSCCVSVHLYFYSMYENGFCLSVKKMAPIPLELRKSIVIKFCSQNISIRKIALQEGVSEGAVRKIINKWGEHATLSNLWWKMTGRGATDPRKERKVVDKILEEPSISVRSAGVSVGTVQNIKKRNNLYEEACHRRPRRIQGYMEKSQHEERKIHDQDVNAQGSVQDLKILLWWTSWLIFLLYSILQYFIHNLYY